MDWKLKTAPAVEPVSLSEAKSFLRITDTDDDTLITAFIVAARQACEEFTGRALITQTWTMFLDNFPRDEAKNAPPDGWFELPVNYFDNVRRSIAIPRPPLQSITHLKTYGLDNAATTFDATNYIVDTTSEPGRIALNYSSTWPVNLRSYNAVEVEFISGYGSAASSIPDGIRQGINVLIKTLFIAKSKLFESDEATGGVTAITTAKGLPEIVQTLWKPYKILKV